MKRVGFYIAVSAFFVSVATALLLFNEFNFYSGSVFSLGAVFVAFSAGYFLSDGKWKFALVGMLLFAGIFAGMGVVYSDFKNSSELSEKVFGRNVTIYGNVKGAVDERVGSFRLRVAVEGIAFGDEFEVVDGVDILVVSDKFTDVEPGDAVVLSGRLQRPRNFVTITGSLFDYGKYFYQKGLCCQMFYPDVSVLGGGGRGVAGFLYRLRDEMSDRIRKVFASPEAGLVAGVLLGDRSGLSYELKDDFVKSGLSHIVVLSGYNIAIMAVVVGFLFNFIFGARGAIFTIVGIWLFTFMVGFDAAVLRATIMMSVLLFSGMFGVRADALKAVLVAGVAMVAVNPRILLWDLSFQLSMLATIGVLAGAPFLERFLGFIPERFDLRNILATTVAVYLFVMPVIIFSTGNLSVLFWLSNLLVLPFVPIIMAVGVGTVLLSYVNLGVAIVAGYPAYILSKYVLRVAEIVAEWRFSYYFTQNFVAQIVLAGIGLVFIALAMIYYFRRGGFSYGVEFFAKPHR